MKNEAHTEVSLMKADRDVLTSIRMRASRQMSYCPPLVDYTPLERHKWLQKHADEPHQYAFYTNEM